MKDLIAEQLFTVTDVLSAEECLQFIDRGESMDFEAATVSTTGGPRMMTNVRNNDRVVFDDPKLAEMLWQCVAAYVPAEIDGTIAVGLNEKFRYYRYDPSQRFNGHRDWPCRAVCARAKPPDFHDLPQRRLRGRPNRLLLRTASAACGRSSPPSSRSPAWACSSRTNGGTKEPKCLAGEST